MSRIGRMPVVIPAGVKVKINGTEVAVEGPKGKLNRQIHPKMSVELKDNHLLVSRQDESKQCKALHGLTRALLANMVSGASQGYTRKLEIEGVGFRAAVEGKKLVMTLGFSHPVEMEIPAGVQVAVEKQVSLAISGADKEAVGQFAANVRFKKPPEPYRGKGIRYSDEVVRRKAGKAAATGGGK
jgi:large subunit ribosomal protein L6